MSTAFIDDKTAYQIIYNRLCEGWIIITGDRDALGIMERIVYPPGTMKNADIEFLTVPMRYFWIGRKTQELKHFLKMENWPTEWKEMIHLRLTMESGDQIHVETKHLGLGKSRKKDIEEFVRSYTGLNVR